VFYGKSNGARRPRSCHLLFSMSLLPPQMTMGHRSVTRSIFGLTELQRTKALFGDQAIPGKMFGDRFGFVNNDRVVLGLIEAEAELGL